MSPRSLAINAVGAVVWVAGILLLKDRLATVIFAVAFAIALPLTLHLAGQARTKELGAFLIVILPLAAIVFDEQDSLALLVPVAIAVVLALNMLDRDR